MLKTIKHLQKMHNLTANFGKFLDACTLYEVWGICNKFGKKFTNEKGNITRRGVVPKFSDLEVVALSLTAEALSIDNGTKNKKIKFRAFALSTINQNHFLQIKFVFLPKTYWNDKNWR